MSIYTTPLQFGYILALLFALLFWIRSYREERLSDTFLGFVMFFLAMEIQDYTFGFSGINVLWEEFNGFPRYFHLAFAPTIYFYLKSQINRNFRFTPIHLKHYILYFLYVIVNLVIFFQGSKVVNSFQKTEFSYWIGIIEDIVIWSSYAYYFFLSLKLFKEYQVWVKNQYSDSDSISFIWLRNFIYLLITGEVFRLFWYGIDRIMGDLPFEQDWWWHLFTVLIICYVGINGYSQAQPKKLEFEETTEVQDTPLVNPSQKSEIPLDYAEWKPKIDKLFSEQKVFLDADLSLSDVAFKLKTNSSVLSAAINQNYKKNFNDFVNEYRVEEFKKLVQSPEYKNLTLLAVAFDAGFNSKPTFNRAVKKFTGKSPKEYI